MKTTRTEKNTITRRTFVREISSIGLGLALAPTLLNFHVERAHAIENAGKIVVATSNYLTNGLSVNTDVANLLLNAAIKPLTGKNSVEEAWKSIFPSLTQNDIIGIKINTLFQLSTHIQVVDAIVQNLVAIGVPGNNIIIWDKSDGDLTSSGYKINRGETGVRCFGTNADYDNKIYKIGGQSKRLSKILTQTCDHLINVPVLKDHSISGVTFSLKNHYGSVDNPGSLHGNNCDPYIADLNNTDPIKEKTSLIVLDASVGVYNRVGLPNFTTTALFWDMIQLLWIITVCKLSTKSVKIMDFNQSLMLDVRRNTFRLRQNLGLAQWTRLKCR